jgi:dienelactone hydrolase
MVRLLTSAAVAAALLAPSAHAFQRFPAGCARAAFPSGGAAVRAELCRSSARGGPAVVVLHGCGGFSTFDHRLAVDLPKAGIATLDVDYFQPTPPPGRRGFCGGVGGDTAFSVWRREAVDAAAALRARGFGKVGVVGWSMGGAVALAAAEQPGHAFDALAGFSTGGYGAAQTAVGKLPPTILLSGGPHDAIPSSDTRALYDAIRRAGVPATFFVYGNGTHNWPGTQGSVGIAKAAAFLRANLR